MTLKCMYLNSILLFLKLIFVFMLLDVLCKSQDTMSHCTGWFLYLFLCNTQFITMRYHYFILLLFFFFVLSSRI